MKYLILNGVDEYKKYYETEYCKAPIFTFDNIPIYFHKNRFSHAFYESSDRRNSKDVFSQERAKRMRWIKSILKSNTATILQGWNKKKKQYEPCLRVAYEYEKFVVIVRISLKNDDTLKGNFITCYYADNSFQKIEKSPIWNKEDCLKYLKGR
ncbi:hypothetical protein [Nautilia sp.]